MTDKRRLEEIKNSHLRGIHSLFGTPWVSIPKENFDWLINRVEELEKQRNERTHLLNAEVARNVRYKKVLEKIVNHAGANKEIDYELWKMAKGALEGEE